MDPVFLDLERVQEIQKINGVPVIADEVEAAEMVLAVAQGQADKAAIADFLRQNSKER